MNKTSKLILTAALTSLTAVAASAVKVEMKDSSGKDVGTAMISPAGQGVKVKLNLMDLPPGVHAIHFHTKASCEGPDFKSAGGHFNPASKHHGLQNPEGPHAGDMANFTVGANGKARATIMDPNVTLADGDNSLYAGGGTALMVHAKADDMHSDPSGNSGDRIACGTITK